MTAHRLAGIVATFLPLLALLGCGGGGGGGSAAPPAPPPPTPPAAPTPAPSLKLSPTSISVSAAFGSPQAPTASVRLTIENPRPGETYYGGVDAVPSIVQSTQFERGFGYNAEVRVNFRDGASVAPGVHEATLTVLTCYDAYCTRHVQGSPAKVSLIYTSTAAPAPPSPGATAEPEAGIASLEPLSRVALTHDVVDAEFSAALNAVVTVSSKPVAALHVHDLATGHERSVALSRPPTAVSVGPDGYYAVVGHDALLTYVDLRMVGVTGAEAPKEIPVSSRVFDVVLAGNGYAYAFPFTSQWVRLHSVEIAAGTETVGTQLIWERTRARLQPGSDAIYGAENGLLPDDIEKFSIKDGPAINVYDSRYHGDYPFCGNLWFNADGSRIYTACGTLLTTAAVQADDMLYAGRLVFSPVANEHFVRAVEASVNPATGAVLFLTEPNNGCDRAVSPNLCWTRVEEFASGALTPRLLYSLPPIEVAGTRYPQRGLFVFHSDGGSTRVLISRAAGSPLAGQEYYLSRF